MLYGRMFEVHLRSHKVHYKEIYIFGHILCPVLVHYTPNRYRWNILMFTEICHLTTFSFKMISVTFTRARALNHYDLRTRYRCTEIKTKNINGKKMKMTCLRFFIFFTRSSQINTLYLNVIINVGITKS